MQIDATPDKERQVCSSCKRRKRKCNKALPKCSSCAKRNLKCNYLTPYESRKATSTSDRQWYEFTTHAEGPHVQSLDFPTILFLDPDLLNHGQIEIPRAPDPVPTHILHLLGGADEIHATASTFFTHVHLWMPFVPKKRFYELYLRPSFQTPPDVVLLLLAMKLITTSPPTNPRNPRTSLYQAAKHFYIDVEGSSLFSMPILQAGVLLALYEVAHAIYPVAYLSIGACARLANAHGITTSGASNTRRVLTLIELEERRRVCWAITILDRFVSIGCPGRSFATAEPSMDDVLPADDTAWDQGTLTKDDFFPLSSPGISHMSKFALLCQAARLLGQVLHYVSSDAATEDDSWIQLDRTLHSILTASLEVDPPDDNQITLIYSALIALHTPWLHADSEDLATTDRSRRAKDVFQSIIARIGANLLKRRCFLDRNPEDIPPWGLFFAYRICVEHLRSRREVLCSAEIVKSLSETFEMINTRWNAAGVYLQLLEGQEALSCF